MQGRLDDSTLTDLGRIMARQVGAALHGLPLHAIYCSPLRRAKSTLDLLLETWSSPDLATPPIKLTPDLMEVNLFEWEGMTFTDIKAKVPDAYETWQARPHELQMKMDTPKAQFPSIPFVICMSRPNGFG